MTIIRKEFSKETLELNKDNKERLEKLKAWQEKQQQLQNLDIEQFKKNRSFIAGMADRNTRVDHLISSKESNASSKSLDEMKMERQVTRIHNYKANLETEKEKRLQNLLSLYHSASSFITYQNMSEKIDHCLETADSSPAADSTISVLLQNKKNVTERAWKGNSGFNQSPRMEALKNVLFGTDNGKESLDVIKKIIHDNEEGASKLEKDVQMYEQMIRAPSNTYAPGLSSSTSPLKSETTTVPDVDALVKEEEEEAKKTESELARHILDIRSGLEKGGKKSGLEVENVFCKESVDKIKEGYQKQKLKSGQFLVVKKKTTPEVLNA